MNKIKAFLDKAKAAGYYELQPNDWTRGVRLGSLDEAVWIDLDEASGLRILLIHAESNRWQDLIRLSVEFANEFGCPLEVHDWSKREDVPASFPRGFSQVIKRYGFTKHPWKAQWRREHFAN